MAEAYLKSLKLPNISVQSSGCVADTYKTDNEQRIPHVIAVLDKHNISQYAKRHPEQLTQQRVDDADITICTNQRVANESKRIVTLPPNVQIWDVEDAGEGARTLKPGDDPYKFGEEIYEQIVHKVDELVEDPPEQIGASLV